MTPSLQAVVAFGSGNRRGKRDNKTIALFFFFILWILANELEMKLLLKHT